MLDLLLILKPSDCHERSVTMAFAHFRVRCTRRNPSIADGVVQKLRRQVSVVNLLLHQSESVSMSTCCRLVDDSNRGFTTL